MSRGVCSHGRSASPLSERWTALSCGTEVIWGVTGMGNGSSLLGLELALSLVLEENPPWNQVLVLACDF